MVVTSRWRLRRPGSIERASEWLIVNGEYHKMDSRLRGNDSMEVMMETLTNGLFLAAVNTAVINYLVEPVRVKKPDLDLWWVLYVALLTGFVLAWFAGVNLFGAQIENVLVGRILSGILVGGGSSLIHNVFDRPNIGEVVLEAEIEGT